MSKFIVVYADAPATWVIILNIEQIVYVGFRNDLIEIYLPSTDIPITVSIKNFKENILPYINTHNISKITLKDNRKKENA